jgi:hypothetical protein
MWWHHHAGQQATPATEHYGGTMAPHSVGGSGNSITEAMAVDKSGWIWFFS